MIVKLKVGWTNYLIEPYFNSNRMHRLFKKSFLTGKWKSIGLDRSVQNLIDTAKGIKNGKKKKY